MSLIGLPETYRFAVFNQTGIAIASNTTPTVQLRRTRFDTTGTLSYDTNATFFSLGTVTSIGNNSYVIGSTISNTASYWLAWDGLCSAFASGNASGNLYLYLEASPDAGATWPTPASADGAGGGVLIAVLGYGSTTTISTASTVQRAYFTYP